MARRDPEMEADFGDILAAFEHQQAGGAGRKEPEIGERVRGEVVSISAGVAFVDFGAKSEGAIELDELRDAEGALSVGVGDSVEATVAGRDEGGGWVLRTKIGRGTQTSSEELRQAHEHRVAVEGLVTGVNKGGVEVQVAGLRAFCPISQLDLRYVEDAEAYVGQRLSFRVTRYEEDDRGRRPPNVVLSRKVLLEEEQRALAEETRKGLGVGAVVRGKVSSLTSYGAFVDLGGLEGLLHVSEIGHERVADPRDVLSEGQELEVEVLKIEPARKEGGSERISLSRRSLLKSPWDDAAERFAVGSSHRGRVARVAHFGAFVELAPGVEGLLHVSEMALERAVDDARQAARVGEEMTVRVLHLEPERRRISLTRVPDAGPQVEAEATGARSGALGSLGDFFDRGS